MTLKTVFSILLTLVGAVLCYLLFTSTDMTWDLLVDALRQMDLTIALGSLLFIATMQLFSALKWRLVTEAQSESTLGLLFYFRYVSASSALGQLMPLTLTNATVRAIALKRKDVMPVMKTAGLFLWDQGFDFLALFLLLSSGLTFLLWGVGGYVALAFLLTCVVTITAAMPTFTRLISRLAALLGKQSIIPELLRSKLCALANANILAPRLARNLFLFSICKFIASTMFYTCIIAAFGHTSMANVAFWGAPSAEMAGVLSQMPGGLGALDWTWLGILTGHGLSAQNAAGIAFGIRCALLSTNWLMGGIVWFLYLTFLKKYKKA